MKKNAAKRRQKKITTAVLGVVTAVLVVGAVGTVLYTTVLKDVFGAKETKIVVTDVNGSELEFLPEELQLQLDTNTFYEGITIDGIDVSGKTKEEVINLFSQTTKTNAEDILNIQFQVGEDLVPLDVSGLSVTSNINEVIEKAYAYGRTSTLSGNDGLKDRYNTINSLKVKPVDFASSYTISTTGVDVLTHDVLDPYQQPVVEAHASGFDVNELKFIIEPSEAGCDVNINKAITDVKTAIANSEYEIIIPVEIETVLPNTTAEYLESYLGLVATTSSTTNDNSNRNTNIRLVCEKIDGLVLQPGEHFNFNDYVGERTPEKGYKEALGINGGVYKPEYGGGICQANTMLYHSVTKADLQVDERRNHTYPSSYVDYGTDATVTWTSPNFQFTNNTDYPIAIHAYYYDQNVTVSIYGRPLPDGQKIALIGEKISETPPTGVVYIADPTLPVGQRETVKSAHTGYQYKSWKVYYDKDGNEIKRVEYFKSDYPMTNDEIKVGTLGPDGKVYDMDKSTGKVNIPDDVIATTNPESTEATSEPQETTPEVTETEATETTPPPPSETPADTQPQPTDPTLEQQGENGGGDNGGDNGGGEPQE